MGSQALAGKWQPEWTELTDERGVSLAEAMIEFGLDPLKAMDAKRDQESILGFLEVHIEQGPLLEKRGLPVGVVTDIAGARRFDFVVEGKAGHSGTVPSSAGRTTPESTVLTSGTPLPPASGSSSVVHTSEPSASSGASGAAAKKSTQ